VLRRPHFLHADRQSRSTDVVDVNWYNQHSEPMTDADWHNYENPFLALLLPGDASEAVDVSGELENGDGLLILVNFSNDPIDFDLQRLPALASNWQILINTASEQADISDMSENRHTLFVHADSVAVARCYTPT